MMNAFGYRSSTLVPSDRIGIGKSRIAKTNFMANAPHGVRSQGRYYKTVPKAEEKDATRTSNVVQNGILFSQVRCDGFPTVLENENTDITGTSHQEHVKKLGWKSEGRKTKQLPGTLKGACIEDKSQKIPNNSAKKQAANNVVAEGRQIGKEGGKLDFGFTSRLAKPSRYVLPGFDGDSLKFQENSHETSVNRINSKMQLKSYSYNSSQENSLDATAKGINSKKPLQSFSSDNTLYGITETSNSTPNGLAADEENSISNNPIQSSTQKDISLRRIPAAMKSREKSRETNAIGLNSKRPLQNSQARGATSFEGAAMANGCEDTASKAGKRTSHQGSKNCNGKPVGILKPKEGLVPEKTSAKANGKVMQPVGGRGTKNVPEVRLVLANPDGANSEQKNLATRKAERVVYNEKDSIKPRAISDGRIGRVTKAGPQKPRTKVVKEGTVAKRTGQGSKAVDCNLQKKQFQENKVRMKNLQEKKEEVVEDAECEEMVRRGGKNDGQLERESSVAEAVAAEWGVRCSAVNGKDIGDVGEKRVSFDEESLKKDSDRMKVKMKTAGSRQAAFVYRRAKQEDCEGDRMRLSVESNAMTSHKTQEDGRSEVMTSYGKRKEVEAGLVTSPYAKYEVSCDTKAKSQRPMQGTHAETAKERFTKIQPNSRDHEKHLGLKNAEIVVAKQQKNSSKPKECSNGELLLIADKRDEMRCRRTGQQLLPPPGVSLNASSDDDLLASAENHADLRSANFQPSYDYGSLDRNQLRSRGKMKARQNDYGDVLIIKSLSDPKMANENQGDVLSSFTKEFLTRDENRCAWQDSDHQMKIPTKQTIVSQLTKQPIVSQPLKQPIVSQPLKQPIASQLTKQPIASQLTKQPIASQPLKQPIASQLTKQPIASQLTKQPIASQPLKQPIASQPLKQSIVSQPLKEPIVSQPIKEPIVSEPIKQSLFKPNDKLTTVKDIYPLSVKSFLPDSQESQKELVLTNRFVLHRDRCDDGRCKREAIGMNCAWEENLDVGVIRKMGREKMEEQAKENHQTEEERSWKVTGKGEWSASSVHTRPQCNENLLTPSQLRTNTTGNTSGGCKFMKLEEDAEVKEASPSAPKSMVPPVPPKRTVSNENRRSNDDGLKCMSGGEMFTNDDFMSVNGDPADSKHYGNWAKQQPRCNANTNDVSVAAHRTRFEDSNSSLSEEADMGQSIAAFSRPKMPSREVRQSGCGVQLERKMSPIIEDVKAEKGELNSPKSGANSMRHAGGESRNTPRGKDSYAQRTRLVGARPLSLTRDSACSNPSLSARGSAVHGEGKRAAKNGKNRNNERPKQTNFISSLVRMLQEGRSECRTLSTENIDCYDKTVLVDMQTNQSPGQVVLTDDDYVVDEEDPFYQFSLKQGKRLL